MPRSNPQYYISPTAVSITPNANNSVNDLAINVARDTSIKIYAPEINVGYRWPQRTSGKGLDYVDNEVQSWKLRSRNRRLRTNEKYNIYARLNKEDHEDAYLVFSVNDYVLTENITGEDLVREDGSVCPGVGPEQDPDSFGYGVRTSYWWVKIGEVGAVAQGTREITLDTGILGTEEYNNEWQHNPDTLPLRVVLTTSKTSGQTAAPPFVPNDDSITVTAALTEGWSIDANSRADHWTVRRDSGDATADAAWNAQAAMDGRTIQLLHYPDTHDDFGEAAANVFTFSAIDADGNVLASASLSIIAEQPSSVYNAYLDFNAFTLTVDDVGNVIGGLWKSDTMVVDSDEEEVRDYRVHAAAFAMKGADFLALAPLGAAPGKGEYQLYPSDDGQCSIVIENGTIYVTGIENIYDGDASTSEDIDFDAMRAMKEATATVVVNFENRATQVLSLGITLYHEPTPFIELSLDNHASHISWSTRHGHYHGMPVEMNIGLQRNNNRLDIAAIAIYDGNTIIAYSSADTDSSDSSDESAPGTWNIAINRATGHIAILGVPTDIAEITELDIHATTTYAGVSYERSIVHTLRKTTDTNVFEIWPSQAVITQRYAFTQSSGTLVRSVVMDINGGALSFYVSCDNDQDEHYHLTPTQMQDEGLKAFYALVRNGSESARTEIAVTATLTAQQLAGASRVIFYLVRNAGTASEFIEDMQPVEITAPVTDGITIGLLNDTDSVVYDEVGRLIGTMPETRAYLRFGDVDISTLATWSVTLVNCTADTTVQLPALKIASVTKTVQQDGTLAPIYADIKATYDNEEYTARFAIACVTNGKHKYWMELSDEIIIYDEEDGTILPQTMDVRLRQNPGEDFDGEEQDIDVNIGASDSDQITLGEGNWTIPHATLLDYVQRALTDGTPSITFDWVIEGVMESEKVNIVRNVKGKDGTLVEYIFRRGTKSPTDTIAPDTTFWQDTDTGGFRWQGAWTQDGVTHDPSQDDFVPRGWTDDAVGVDSANNYELCAYRTKNANGTWGAFRSPFTFAVYGRSAAYYTEQEFAWSKDKSTASATTSPDLEGGSWTSYTPAQPSAAKPFLWMRTRRWTFQEQQNTYTSSSWTYTRLTGESGTGIALSGSFVLSDWSPTYPDIPTYLAAAHPSPSTGECYIYQEDGHLWVWNGTAWQDVGQIKGDSGVSQYIHIAWAHSLGTGTDWTNQGTGFVTEKTAADVYEYIGILANEDPNADPDITHAGEYTWNYVKGPQGDPGVSVVELDLDNELDTLLYSSSAMTTPVGSLPRTTWTLMQGRDDISDQVPSANITFQATGCSAAWVTGTAKRTLEVTNFTGASVTTAKVEVRVTFGDNTYVKVLSVKRLVDEDKYELVCTPNNIIVNTNDPATTTTCNVKVYKTSPVTGQRTLVTQLTGARYLFVNPVADGGAETENPVTGYGASGYSWTADKTKAAYHIVLATTPTMATASIIDSETIPIAKVQNGRNVVRVDLTNGMDSILYNSSNLNAPTSGVLLPKTQVKVYDGDVDVTEMLGTGAITIYSYENVPAPGATLGPTLNGNELTVNHVTAASATVTLRVGYNGTYYYATFSVKRLVDQDKYELQCDPDHFACNTTTQTGTTQTCRVYVYKTDAVTGQRSLVPSLSGLYLYYSSSQSQQLTPLGTYSSGVSFDASSANDYYRIYLLDAQPTAQSPYTDHIVDTETLPFTKVADGTSPWVADLNNEMDSVACDIDGHPSQSQAVQTSISLYNGATKKNFKITSIKRNGSTTLGTGVTVSPTASSSTSYSSPKTLTVTYATSATITGKDDFEITIQSSNDSTVTRTLHFTVNGIKPGQNGEPATIYNLLPSDSQVSIGRTNSGGYTPSTFSLTCGYVKNVGGTMTTVADATSQIDSKYNIYYRKRIRSNSSWQTTYYRYGTYKSSSTAEYTLTNISVATYDAVEFIICTATSSSFSASNIGSYSVIDKETVPVVSDGLDGKNPDYIHLCGHSWVSTDDVYDTDVSVNGGADMLPDGRWKGLSLVKINRMTLAQVGTTQNYDTYTDASLIQTLISNLDSLDGSVFVCLVSQDACTINADLAAKLGEFGADSSRVPQVTQGRLAFAFIGYKGLAQKYGKMAYSEIGSDLRAEFIVYVANGAINVTRDGEDGQDGTAYDILSSTNAVVIPADQTAGTLTTTLTFRKYVGGTVDSSFAPYYAIYRRSGSTYRRYTYGSGSSTSVSNVSTNFTVGSTTYHADAFIVVIASSSITTTSSLPSSYLAILEIPVLKNGNTGPQGKIGRSYYYAGEYSSTKGYTLTDAEAPFVSITNGNTVSYYVRIGNNGAVTGHAPASYPTEWQEMSSQFMYLISEAVFSRFAKLGSGVFNDDWLYSQYGNANTNLLFSGTFTSTSSTWVRVGTFSFPVIMGEIYTLRITAKATSSSNSITFRSSYLKDDGTYDGSMHDRVGVSTDSTTNVTLTLSFIAVMNGMCALAIHEPGTVSRVEIDRPISNDYEKMSPDFLRDNPLVLYDGNGYGIASTTYDKFVYSPLRLVSGKTYKLTVTAKKATSSLATGYVAIIDNAGTVRSVKVNNVANTVVMTSWTTEKSTDSMQFTVVTTGEYYIGVKTSSGSSATVTTYGLYLFNVTIEAVNPFIPKVAIDWLSGYAHFAGGNAKFFPDGSLSFKNGYMAGFLRTVPTVILTSNLSTFMAAEDFVDKEHEDANVLSTLSDCLLPYHSINCKSINLDRSGSHLLFYDDNYGSMDVLVHLPFVFPHANSAYSHFAWAYYKGMTTQGGSGVMPSYGGNEKTLYDFSCPEVLRARSFIGSQVEITNMTNGNIEVCGLVSTGISEAARISIPTKSINDNGSITPTGTPIGGYTPTSPWQLISIPPMGILRATCVRVTESGSNISDLERIFWRVDSYATTNYKYTRESLGI